MSLPRTVLWPSLALALTACPDRSGPGALLDSDRPCAVRLDAPPPSLTPAPAVATPRSRIVVEAVASTHAIARELSENVPVQLARERRRSIGAAGEVSYEVRRGGFSVSLRGERLVATTPVSAEVDVCKPLGPVCLGYGRCSPRLAATASIPLVLGEDYSMGKSQVGIALTRGCVIAGFDASGEIRRIARQNVGTVQRRIDRGLPRLPSYVGGAWRLLHVPVALDRDTCLKLAPKDLAQSKPRAEDETLTVRFAVTGEIALENPCAEQPVEDPPELPRHRVDEIEPGIALAIPVRLSFSEVSAELTRSLSAAPRDGQHFHVAKVAASGVQVKGKARMQLRVTLDGTACGELSLLATPRFDPNAARLRLEDVSAAEPLDAELVSRLRRLVETHASVALPVDASGAHHALTSWVEGLTKQLPQELNAKIQLKPVRVERVELDSTHLIPVLAIEGSARLSLQ